MHKISYKLRNILLCVLCIALSFSLVGIYADECGTNNNFKQVRNVQSNVVNCKESNNISDAISGKKGKEVTSIEQIQIAETVFSIFSNIRNSINDQFGAKRVRGCFESLMVVLSYADIVALVVLTLFAVNKLRQKSVHLIISRYIQNKDGKKEALSHVG